MPNETLLDIFSVDGAGLQVENYIYMYHLQEFIVLPSFVDSVQDNFGISWQPTTPLGRSAPIYSFTSAGPRTVQVTFTLHRDMMFQINKGVSDAKVDLGDDYVDTLIKDLQACVLPDYDGSSKSVNPPIVALRVGNDIFIKGVITSNLGITWNYPILSNGKYSNMNINLTISEIDPYDARTVQQTGSYRNLNLNSTLDYGTITTAMDTFYSDPFDEYGGIVGGNLANMPNQIRAQRALQQQQSTSSVNSSTLSNSYNLTRTILNNGVHPNRQSTDVQINYSKNSSLTPVHLGEASMNLYEKTRVDENNQYIYSYEERIKAYEDLMDPIENGLVIRRGAKQDRGRAVSVYNRKIADYDEAGIAALEAAADAEQYGLSKKRSAKGAEVVDSESTSTNMPNQMKVQGTAPQGRGVRSNR